MVVVMWTIQRFTPRYHPVIFPTVYGDYRYFFPSQLVCAFTTLILHIPEEYQFGRGRFCEPAEGGCHCSIWICCAVFLSKVSATWTIRPLFLRCYFSNVVVLVVYFSVRPFGPLLMRSYSVILGVYLFILVHGHSATLQPFRKFGHYGHFCHYGHYGHYGHFGCWPKDWPNDFFFRHLSTFFVTRACCFITQTKKLTKLTIIMTYPVGDPLTPTHPYKQYPRT